MAPVRCTYSDCCQTFENEKDMRRHKKNATEHDYCRKCDLDCANWESFVQHKVTTMDEWQRTPRDDREPSPKHITCEFCGADFETFGSRKAHREQMHRADQEIRCPGCTALFTTAANMVSHLEKGKCEKITAYEFRSWLIHKRIRKMMKEKWAEVLERLAGNCRQWQFPPIYGKQASTAITDGTEAMDEDGGGVALIDTMDREQRAINEDTKYDPLEPEVDARDERVMLTQKLLKSWPKLPTLSTPSDLERARTLPLIAQASMPGDSVLDFQSNLIAASHSGAGHYHKSYSSPGSPTTTISADGEDGSASGVAVQLHNARIMSRAWMTGNTAKALFKETNKSTLQNSQSLTLVKETGLGETRNLADTRFYDPSCTADFNMEMFLHPLTETYVCPIPGCDDLTGNFCRFDDAEDLRDHLVTAHMDVQLSCKTCLRRFKSAAGLVAHMEQTSKCRIRDSEDFYKLLDEVTGGFIKAKHLPVPFVLQTGKAMVKAEQSLQRGVMPVKYESQYPT